MAPTISAEAVQQARAFVAQNARPLDRAYLDHRLAATADSAARVVAELTKFQTVEGGFGRALEPDVRTPASLPQHRAGSGGSLYNCALIRS